MPTVSETYGCGGHYAAAQSFLASIEAEIEGLQDAPGVVGNWGAKADGSLRGHGMEYVSTYARDRKDLLNDVTVLYSNLKFRKSEPPFSERTSTHVHVNVSNLQMDHVRTMVLLYALYEEFFFRMVQPARRENIHCVALTETFLPAHYKENLVQYHERWHKYTALNLKRLHDLGTLEFRHLHGTNDLVEIGEWLHVLENLWKLAQRVTIDKATLSSQETLNEWFDLLFFPCNKVMALKPHLKTIIKNNLIDVKLSIPSEGK